MERTERKGMTGIRRWVDGHTDRISDGRVVIDFAFAFVSLFVFLYLYDWHEVQRRQDIRRL